MIKKNLNIFGCLLLLFLSSSGIVNAQDRPSDFELITIEFNGNEVIDDSELQYIIASIESPVWISQMFNKITGFGNEPVYFDSLLIPTDIRALQQFYYDNGYFEAEFNYSYTLDTNDMTAVLIYEIYEGDPAYYNKFELTGISKLLEELKKDLDEMRTVDTNEVYSKNFVLGRITEITNYLKDKGYMLSEVDEPQVLVDTVANHTDITLNISTGKRYLIKDVRIEKRGEGKNLVSDELIDRISSVKEEQFYNYYELQRARLRLYRTNLFSSALVSGIVSDTVGSRVPISISVDVGLLNEFSPELILNNEDNALNTGIGLSYTRKNFLGDARRLTISTSAAAQSISEFIANPSVSDTTIFGYADARLILQQPFLFGETISTTFEIFSTIQKRRDEYNATIYGGRLTFDFELGRYVYFNNFSSYISVERTKYIYRDSYAYNLLSSGTNITPEQADSVINSPSWNAVREGTNAYIGFSLGANKTNSILFPTGGYTLSFLLEEGNSLAYLFTSLGDFNFNEPLFYKILTSASYYPPVYSSDDNAFGIKFKIGYIHTYSGDKKQIPLKQRLYSGGSNSIRGWLAQELVPDADKVIDITQATDNLETILASDITPGGFFTMEGSFETRNRLLSNIGSAVFLDFGNTWINYTDVQLKNIAVAAGFGFRYYSSVVPIRLDFGFKVYDPNDPKSFFKKRFWAETFTFHFGIGEAF